MNKPPLTPAWEVVYLYLLESHRGKLTRGFASIQTEVLKIQTGMTFATLKKALEVMEGQNMIVLHQVDGSAIDIAVTAVGMAKYISRESA